MTHIVATALAHPPVDTTYVAGRWHPARISLRGVWTETRVLGASLMRPKNRDVTRFLILCRARSGSTLLTQLLNAHPNITCDREVLACRVLSPRGYLRRLAYKSRAPVYGAKLLSYQMVQVQKFRDPVRFLHQLHEDGVRLIHIERDCFAQTLSLAMAQTRQVFHHSEKTGVGKAEWQRTSANPHHATRIDPRSFVKRLSWSRILLEYERHCLADLPFLRLSYETDLQERRNQQVSADRVFEWLGTGSAPVSGALRKLLPSDPQETISNYSEIAQAVWKAGMEDLLPDGDTGR